MSDDLDRAWLSPLLNRIADIAGMRAALLIGQEKACQEIYIPRRFGARHWLPKLIGQEAAEKLAAEMGGSKLVVPPALVGQKRQRARAIAEMNAKGYSISRIAAGVGVARSTVSLHRSRTRDEEDTQGKLL
ncbi:hypothetical protein [Aliihoeflea sp. PC F10.4]